MSIYGQPEQHRRPEAAGPLFLKPSPPPANSPLPFSQLSPPVTKSSSPNYWNTSTTEEALNATLTIRILVHGKDADSDIGKERKSVKILEKSGAHINISEGNCPGIIITLAGSTDAIIKAFTIVTDKLKKVISISTTNSTAARRPSVSLQLVVPASQCRSL